MDFRFEIIGSTLSDQQTTCQCKPGYSGSVGTSSGSNTCVACNGNNFTAAPGQGSCTACGTGAKVKADFTGCDCFDTGAGTAAWTSATNKCECKKDFYGNPSAATSAQNNGCTACPTGATTAAAGKTAITDCTCADSGFATLAVGDITCKCKAGTYGNGVIAGSCTNCPSNTWSSAGATASTNCDSCAANYYKSSTGNNALACTGCPAESASTAGSKTDITACVCKDANANTLSSTVTTCTCKSGYSGSATTASPCATNAVILSAFAALLSLVILI